jgi:IrrE N-terminal-like domain
MLISVRNSSHDMRITMGRRPRFKKGAKTNAERQRRRTRKREAGPGLVFDMDGFFLQLIQAEKDVTAESWGGVLYSRDPTVRRLLLLYYILARSSAAFIVSDNPDAREAMSQWQRTCVNSAGALTAKHLETGYAVSPTWVEQCREDVTMVHPTFADVQIKVTVAPRFDAFVASASEIRISAVTREFLRHYNHSISMLVEEDGHTWLTNLETAAKSHKDHDDTFRRGVAALVDIPPDIQSAARMMLPYWIFSHDAIDPRALPWSGTLSAEFFAKTLVTTRLQMAFVLAHEYAHIILGHVGRPRSSPEDRLKMEIEADQFALQTVVKAASKSKDLASATPGHIWGAMRWLYQYQIIDQMVGDLLRNKSTSFVDYWFEARKNALYAVLPQGVGGADNLREVRGTYILMATKGRIGELGAPFVQRVAELIIEKHRDHRARMLGREEHAATTMLQFETDKWWEAV